MRIAIFGTGCIGSFVGCALHAAGHELTFIDLEDRVRQIRQEGIRLRAPDGSTSHFSDLHSTCDTSRSGVQDAVIIGLKAHQIGPAIDSILNLIGPDTTVITTQNGIPWWYFEHHGGQFNSRTIHSSDPGGIIRSSIDANCVVGCIAYPAVSMCKNGEIVHVEGDKMPVGSVAPGSIERARMVSEIFTGAGFKSRLLDDLRAEIWLKAIGNMSLNPISALTRATLVEICEFADTRDLARQMMIEAEKVANSLDVTLRVSIDRRLEGARRVGEHRSSMLQDVEKGESMEVGALVAAVVELAELTSVPTPTIRTVLAMTRLLNEMVSNESLRIVGVE